MISVTHYQDRDGNFLGGLAPRRYACLACHVPQSTAQPLVDNLY
jgi:nitrate reductase (cytochrome), electron transfer subunit